jgi:hypothetical protein
MITLRKLAALHISDMSGGDQSKDSQIDEREVMLKIRQLMSELLMLKIFEKYNDGDRSAVAQYIASYDVVVATESIYKYSEIPEFFITLPSNRGIHRVYEKDKPRKEFIPLENPAVTQDLESANIYKNSYYYVEGMRIYYTKLSNPNAKKVTMQLIIPAPDTIGKDDALPIIPEQQAQILRLLKEQEIRLPKDYINDSNNASRT